MLKTILLSTTLLAGLLFPQVTYAAEHTIDMTTPIVDDNKIPYKDPTYRRLEGAPECIPCETLTVGRVLSIALRGIYEDEKNLTWQDIYNRGAMAAALRENKAAVLDATELATLEYLVAKAKFSPAILHQVVSIIDPGAKVVGKVR